MDEDRRIEVFARANRRRNAIAGMVMGALIIVGGIIALAVLLSRSNDELGAGMRRGGGYQLVVMAGGGVIAGLWIVAASARMFRRSST